MYPIITVQIKNEKRMANVNPNLDIIVKIFSELDEIISFLTNLNLINSQKPIIRIEGKPFPIKTIATFCFEETLLLLVITLTTLKGSVPESLNQIKSKKSFFLMNFINLFSVKSDK